VELLGYNDVLSALPPKGRSHLLLGNGFSIACDPIFSYRLLYEAAVNSGLSTRAQQVFDRLGTSNFEGVMRLLDDANWMATTYGVPAPQVAEMLTDAEVVKNTLVEAVATSHLAHSGEVPDQKKVSVRRFLKPYWNVFTTNYDLLLYWVVMSEDPPRFQDCFRADSDDPDSPYLVFSAKLGDSPGILYLHGALHLYMQHGELRKHSWIRSGSRLTDSIRDGLKRQAYPLFIAEGSSDKKLQQIQGSGYLWYCLDKLARIKGPLVVFGHSLGDTDGHVASTIARNGDLPRMYVGLFGDGDSERNVAIRSAVAQIQRVRESLASAHSKIGALAVWFYDAQTAHVWDGAAT
jgi:hypothetical protein